MSRYGPMVETGRITALDGWRTISVALVIASHLLIYSGMRILDQSSWLMAKVGTALVAAMATLGVEIFFVISGFVICRGFLREEAADGDVSLVAFYVRRVLRILPPLGLYVATIVALAFLGVLPRSDFQVAHALTFTCNLPGARCGGWLGGHTWSLSIEEQFYIVIPVLFIASGALRRWAMPALVATLVLATTGLELFGADTAAQGLAHFIYIGVGVLCAVFESRLAQMARRTPTWVQAAAIVGLVFFTRLTVTRFWLPASLCLSALIAAVLLTTTFRASGLRTVLKSGPMVAVGRVSYGIYLWQQLATYAWPNATVWFYLISVPLCIAFAFASYRWFERPLIRLGARLSARLKRPKLALDA